MTSLLLQWCMNDLPCTQDSRKLLSERDKELAKVRGELERYRQQAAREIANKTKLAQSLDESHSYAQQLEELLQQWQLEVRFFMDHVSMCVCVSVIVVKLYFEWQ